MATKAANGVEWVNGDLDCALTDMILKAFRPFANEKDLTHKILYISSQIR